jgi:hypothetical protein
VPSDTHPGVQVSAFRGRAIEAVCLPSGPTFPLDVVSVPSPSCRSPSVAQCPLGAVQLLNRGLGLRACSFDTDWNTHAHILCRAMPIAPRSSLLLGVLVLLASVAAISAHGGSRQSRLLDDIAQGVPAGAGREGSKELPASPIQQKEAPKNRHRPLPRSANRTPPSPGLAVKVPGCIWLLACS